MTSRKRPPSLKKKAHGALKCRLSVRFPVPTRKSNDANPPPLETFNTLWHGRDRKEGRVPEINGKKPPILRWKTQRRRMEWWPRQATVDQARSGSSSDVKYKSSRISTDGRKSRGAGVIMNQNALCVSLMDEMYKMSPFNAHPSAELTKAPVAGSGPAEERGRTGYGDPNLASRAEVAASGGIGAGATNQLINVRVKKHETEQQTEARMRSYAYFVEQDGGDEWCYANNKSNSAYKKMRDELKKSWIAAGQTPIPIREESMGSLQMCENPREVYLDHILARGNPEKKIRLLESGSYASVIQTSLKLKRENEKNGKHDLKVTLDQDGRMQLHSIMEKIFAEQRVVSRERVFAILLNTDYSSKLHKIARAYSDARSSNNEDLRAKIDTQLHGWLMDACGEQLKRIQLQCDGMERYVQELDDTSVDNPMRIIVLDVIQKMDARHAAAVRKEDVRSACEEKMVRFTDAQYNKIMKEYCLGNKGQWWMKSGNEARDLASPSSRRV